MTKRSKERHSLPVLNRRDALYGIAGCGLAATAFSGCVVSKIYGELTDTEITFDLNDPTYAPLRNPPNAVPIDVSGWKLLLIRQSNDEMYCLDRLCPHEGAEMAPLQEGRWDADKAQLVCTRHLSVFEADGTFVRGAAGTNIRSFPVEFDPETQQGRVIVSLSQAGQPDLAGQPTEPSVERFSDDGRVTFNIAESPFTNLGQTNGMVAIDAGAWKVVLIRSSDSEVLCLDRLCPHEFAEMVDTKEGTWEPSQQYLICTRHGSIFGSDGSLVSGLATVGINAYLVEFDEATGVGSLDLNVKLEQGNTP